MNKKAMAKWFLSILATGSVLMAPAWADTSDSIQDLLTHVANNPNDLNSFKQLGVLYSQIGDESVKTFVNGKIPTSDQAPFIQDGRTLVPLRAIAEALGAVVRWDAPSQTITLTKGTTVVVLTIGGTTANVSGKRVTLDSAANIYGGRTFVPIRFVSEALGAVVQWIPQGHIVDITTPGSEDLKISNPQVSSLPRSFPNKAEDDSSWWKRASSNLYISVRTGQSFDDGPSLLSVHPGQALNLLTYATSMDVDAAQWFVNSGEAAVSAADANVVWKYQNHTASAATFVAEKPGVYTVQSYANNVYSVPLVILVDADQLTGSAISIDPASSGILPLPGTLPTPLNTTVFSISDTVQMRTTPYPAINGWVPVAGTITTPGVRSVVVDFYTNDGSNEWNYSLPVAPDGTFGALLRIPLHGDVNVSFVHNLFDQLNSKRYWLPDQTYTIHLDAPLPSEEEKGLLASAYTNFNMSPVFAQEASILMDNSPSLDTAIAAISNFVSEKIAYDWQDFSAGKYIFKDSVTTWQDKSGVCKDIAEVTASMLRSIGIPAATVMGTAPKSTGEDNHEWLQAWDGAQWIIMDPTWNSPNKSVNRLLSNENYTNTESLQNSHGTDRNRIGTAQ